jgi:hypothetical protein
MSATEATRMTAPRATSLAACRDYFARSVTQLAALDAGLPTRRSPTSAGTPVARTPEDVVPQAIGGALREHGPGYFSRRLSTGDAAALTRMLREAAGTPPTGCCGVAGQNACYDCAALPAGTGATDPELLFDFALAVLGWRTPGGSRPEPVR